MRKLIAVMLVVLLWSAPALAESRKFNAKLFENAKEALSLISYGENKKALKKLGLSADRSALDTFDEFLINELIDIYHGDVQTKVAVAYQVENGGFRLALPVVPPEDSDVQTLVLKSKDGRSFSSYIAMSWGDVMEEVDASSNVTWNKAYERESPVIIADD